MVRDEDEETDRGDARRKHGRGGRAHHELRYNDEACLFSGNPGAALWPIFACAGGIMTAALVANARDNRELTAPETWSCGVLFWFNPPMPKEKETLSFEQIALRSQARAA
jgi:hypothetical protein